MNFVQQNPHARKKRTHTTLSEHAGFNQLSLNELRTKRALERGTRTQIELNKVIDIENQWNSMKRSEDDQILALAKTACGLLQAMQHKQDGCRKRERTTARKPLLPWQNACKPASTL